MAAYHPPRCRRRRRTPPGRAAELGRVPGPLPTGMRRTDPRVPSRADPRSHRCRRTDRRDVRPGLAVARSVHRHWRGTIAPVAVRDRPPCPSSSVRRHALGRTARDRLQLSQFGPSAVATDGSWLDGLDDDLTTPSPDCPTDSAGRSNSGSSPITPTKRSGAVSTHHAGVPPASASIAGSTRFAAASARLPTTDPPTSPAPSGAHRQETSEWPTSRTSRTSRNSGMP